MESEEKEVDITENPIQQESIGNKLHGSACFSFENGLEVYQNVHLIV